jgi:hypothetical protein
MKITSFKKFIELQESLSLSKYRAIMKDASKISSDVKEHISDDYKTRYESWFGKNKWRVYLPLSSITTDTVYQEVENVLSQLPNPYSIGGADNWKAGLATSKTNPNRKQSIGKILQREGKTDIKKKFDERFKGAKTFSTEEDMTVVISRHPKDILEQTFDKEWANRSCKNVYDGGNRHYIPTEINDGCLIAYCIKNEHLDTPQYKKELIYAPFVIECETVEEVRIAIARLESKAYNFRSDDGIFSTSPQYITYQMISIHNS